MKKMLLITVLMFAVLGIAGCAKEPALEIQAARDAVMQAEKENAAEYAPNSLAAAKEQMNALTAELEAQKGKFALFRSYGKVKEVAAATKAAGEKAIADAQAGKKAAMDAANAALMELQQAHQAALAEIEAAPVGKGSAADIEALKMDLATVGTEIEAITQLIRSEDYNQATTKARAAMQTVADVRAAIAAAVEMKGKSGSH